jgi:hypothetical protein
MSYTSFCTETPAVLEEIVNDCDFWLQTMGRDKRMEFAESFYTCYNFRLLYTSGTLYPILGALRYPVLLVLH